MDLELNIGLHRIESKKRLNEKGLTFSTPWLLKSKLDVFKSLRTPYIIINNKKFTKKKKYKKKNKKKKGYVFVCES